MKDFKLDISKLPAETPPDAPPEVEARREGIMARLLEEAGNSTGRLQEVLQVTERMLHDCRPGSKKDSMLDETVHEAFLRYQKDPGDKLPPPVLDEAVAWLREYMTSRGYPVVAPEGADAPAAQGTPADAAQKAQDMFESVAKARVALGGEQPAPMEKPSEGADAGVKNWQLNPSLGKVRG